MLSDSERSRVGGGCDGLCLDDLNDMGMLLSQQRSHEDELKMFRSGSAPPTVDGSLSAFNGLFGDNGGDPLPGFMSSNNQSKNGFLTAEELRSDPEYLSYYYSNVNMNPRLPPPLLTKEDWRFSQRLKGGNSVLGGIGDQRKPSNSNDGSGKLASLMPPGFSSRKQIESETKYIRGSSQWGSDQLVGLGQGSIQNGVPETLQDDFGHASQNFSRPASRIANDESLVIPSATEAEAEDELSQLRRSSVVRNSSQPPPFTYAAVVGSSLSRNASPDPQLLARAPSPVIAPIGTRRADKRGVKSPNAFFAVPPAANETSDLVAKLSGLGLTSDGAVNEEKRFDYHIDHDVRAHQRHISVNGGKIRLPDKHNGFEASFSDNVNNNGNLIPNSPFFVDNPNSYSQGSASYFNGNGISPPSNNFENANNSFKNYGTSGYNLDPTADSRMAGQQGTSKFPPLYDNLATAAAMGHPRMNLGGMVGELNPILQPQYFNISANNIAAGAGQVPFIDPMYHQYIRAAEYSAAAQLAALSGLPLNHNYIGAPYIDLLGLQDSYMGGGLSSQMSFRGNKNMNSNHSGYYGDPVYGLSYPGSPLASPLLQHSPFGQNDLKMRFNMGMRNLSRLDEFKSNKTKMFELSDITGHIVEFSADQYGSRFIQQKLETATIEEKNIVYREIASEALTLMTDVFGNYVVQKFFEHGPPDHRRELANKLYGNVLSLSLQMYGCRVIQKAIEVVDLDQKIAMVQELDNNIMRCVRDQNGNHVIQKCIECVPEESIHFIISTFFNQVVTLSLHPYGCRVIQRVLENCQNEATQRKVMEEILGSISLLAQDQYGNYVVQHVLEHGKPEERSIIIQELSGRIVRMSQQKFASNVVEKCLTYSSPSERKFLISEMLGTTDENEPLQAMMKDQFGNYVIQKVLETCDDQQRELIMIRIKVHLNTLKKYTYGKHIVARVEKLVAAGERRMAIPTSNLTT